MSIAALVQQLGELSDDVDAEYSEAINAEGGIGIESMIVALLALREAKRGIDLLYRRIENDVIRGTDKKSFTIEGAGEVQIKTSTKRNDWNHDALWRTVVARALDEREMDDDGVIAEPSYETVARVLAECARPSWRVTPLRDRGIDPDEFSHVEYGAKSVVLP